MLIRRRAPMARVIGVSLLTLACAVVVLSQDSPSPARDDSTAADTPAESQPVPAQAATESESAAAPVEQTPRTPSGVCSVKTLTSRKNPCLKIERTSREICAGSTGCATTVPIRARIASSWPLLFPRITT